MAGALAGGHNVGYICDYPIYGQIAGINAFALGVQLTNPKANVYLDWSGTGSVEAALERLTRQGIVLVSSSDVSGLSEQESSLRGLLLVTGDGPVPIARPVLKWGIYYEAIIRQILNRSYQQDYAGSARAWNYYWGMDAGVVGLTYNEDMLDGSRKLAGLLEKSICAGICRPFQDALYDQNGRRHQDWNGELLPEQIIRMDWLMENVVGAIPSYEDLTDTGKVIRRLRTGSKRRWKRRLKKIKRQYREDEITLEEVTRSIASYKGHLKHGHTYKLQKKVFHDFVLTKAKR